jgi:hypothetical protein
MPLRGKSVGWWTFQVGKSLAYLCVALGPFLLEHRDTLFEGKACRPGEHLFADFVLGAPFGYQWFTQAGYRNPSPHLVQLVTLAEGREPKELFDDRGRCRRRLFLTKLIGRIEKQSPSLIVVDYSFPLSGCAEDEQLRSIIANSPVPMIVGLAPETLEQYQNFSGIGSRQSADSNRACLVQTESMELGSTDHRSLVKGGLVWLDQDTSKIPLTWPVNLRNQDGSLGEIERMPTLPLAAVQEYERATDHDLNVRLQSLIAKRKHPYTSFLRTRAIPEIPAIAVLCVPGSFSGNDWDKCRPADAARTLFASPIVLIGERSRRDWHDSPIGGVPGAVVQANYIESLLEDRYLSPVSRRTTLALNIFWIILVEGTFLFLFSRPLRALGLSLLATLGLIAACYILILQWGYFLSLWVLGLGILLPRLRGVEELKHFLEHRSAPPAAAVDGNPSQS